MTSHSFSNLLIALLLCMVATYPAHADSISDSSADEVRAAILVSSIAATGLFKDREGAIQYGKSLIATSAATLLLKELVDSERPNGADNDSFPSGHVSVSVASAAYLHKRYGLKFGLPAYLATAAVAHNRLENDHHHLVDVIASVALALAINNRVTSKLLITPKSVQDGLALQFQIPF